MTDEVENLSGLQGEGARTGMAQAGQSQSTPAAKEPMVTMASGKMISAETARSYSRQVVVVVVYYVVFLLFSIWFILDAFADKFSLIGVFGVDLDAIQPENAAQLEAIVFAVVGGFLGSTLYGIRTLFNIYAKGERDYDPRWLPKYYTLPWEGAGLSVVVLALFRGGVAAFGGTVASDPTEVNSFTTFATGALVGYGTREVVGWLGGIIGSMFPEQPGKEEEPDEEQPPEPPEEAG